MLNEPIAESKGNRGSRVRFFGLGGLVKNADPASMPDLSKEWVAGIGPLEGL